MSLFDDLVDLFPEPVSDIVVVPGSFVAVDLAKVDPCPNCGTPTRRFASVPIGGSGLDLIFAGPWWCADCLQAKTRAAAAGIVRDVTTTKENP